MVMPDRFIDHDSQAKQLAEAGLSAKDIVAVALAAMGIEAPGARFDESPDRDRRDDRTDTASTTWSLACSCGWLLVAAAALAAALAASALPSGAGRRALDAQPLRDLYAALEAAMRAGRATPFAQRFDALAPVVDRVFDLETVLKVSVGLRWDSMDAGVARAPAEGVPPLHHRDLCRQFRQLRRRALPDPAGHRATPGPTGSSAPRSSAATAAHRGWTT